MIVSSNVPGRVVVPACPAGALLVAGLDVEWSRNHRVAGGNVPFCYAVAWLVLPGGGARLDAVPVRYVSVHVREGGQTQDLVTSAGQVLGPVLARASLVAGHQFGSDLAALARVSARPVSGVEAARMAWRRRRLALPGRARILDTCYDADHVLGHGSRRLADICRDLGLHAARPELRDASRAALRRDSVQAAGTAAREKVMVLNLRHALCTALVAAYATGLGRWPGALDVNRLLADRLNGAFAWLADPAFAATAGKDDTGPGQDLLCRLS
jgi:hypothetical protein